MLKFSGAPKKKKEPQSEVRLRNRSRNPVEKENRPQSLILDGNGLGGRKQRPTSFAEKSPTRREFEAEQQLSSYPTSHDDGSHFERVRAATDVTAHLGGALRKSSEGIADFGYTGVSSVDIASSHQEPHSTAFIHGGELILFIQSNRLQCFSTHGSGPKSG